jgi:hypothetical protein
MTFLPIVDRELRVRARLRSTYRFRFFAAVGAILISAVLLLFSLVINRGSHLGSSIFATLAGLSFLYCLMEGARNTADCLSGEKRDGTLGLLFLTDLRGYDVVIGKLVASSINSFYGLMAIFPALAIPLVLGGVTVGEFWRHVLSLINALYLSLTIGLVVSAAGRDERNAWMTTSLIVFLLTVFPPFLLPVPNSVALFLAGLSPFTAFLGAFDAQFASNPDQYWNSIRSVQATSWIALLAASWFLPRRWQDRPVLTERQPHKLRSRNARQLMVETWRRGRLLDVNPVLWMASRQNGSPVALWTLVIGAGIVGTILWFISGGSSAILGVLVAGMFIIHLMLSVWVASEACHALGVARDSGALELLVSTPLTTQQIVNGHLLALRQIFFRPVATLLLIELGLTAASLYLSAARNGLQETDFLLAMYIVFTMGGALLEMQAAANYGLWMGLSSKRPAHAVTKTVLRVIVLPMLVLACWPLYPFIGMLKNAIFINYGRDQLRINFRKYVTERFVNVNPELVTEPPRRVLRGQLPPVLRS